MTIKEAINYLQPIAESAALPSYKEALAMAISAMRQQDQKNDPLTLDELREMDGDPVWCVSLKNSAFNCWGIRFTESVDGYHAGFPDETYGKTWIAYRRKPEGVVG